MYIYIILFEIDKSFLSNILETYPDNLFENEEHSTNKKVEHNISVVHLTISLTIWLVFNSSSGFNIFIRNYHIENKPNKVNEIAKTPV